jgi:hypothetical protein
VPSKGFGEDDMVIETTLKSNEDIGRKWVDMPIATMATVTESTMATVTEPKMVTVTELTIAIVTEPNEGIGKGSFSYGEVNGQVYYFNILLNGIE